jgi:hypothetical protein
MTELLGLAFLLVSRARDKGLKDEEIVWVVERQLEHFGMMEALKELQEEAGE